MAIDSQRAPRSRRVSADDAWLGSVLFMTAQHGETEEKALDLGVHDHLGNPVQTRFLIARVRAVLERASC